MQPKREKLVLNSFTIEDSHFPNQKGKKKQKGGMLLGY